MNSKTTIFIHLFCLALSVMQAQVLTFHKTYRTDSMRYEVTSVALRSKGYCLSANADNFFLDPINGNTKAVLMGVDPLGEIEWVHQFGDLQPLTTISGVIRANTDDGIIVYGRFTETLGGNGALWVAKFDDSGQQIWERRLQREGHDEVAQGQIVPFSGGYLLSGMVFNYSNMTAYNTVMRIDETGNVIGSNGYNNDFFDFTSRYEAYAVNDTAFFMAGGSTFAGAGRVCKLTDGSIITMQTAGMDDMVTFSGLALLPNGKKLLCGVFDAPNGQKRVLIYRSDLFSLAFESSRLIKKEGWENYTVKLTPADGNYFILLLTNGADQSIIVKIDQNGNEQWAWEYDYLLQHLIRTTDGGYVVTGHQPVNATSTDIVCLKMDANGQIPGCTATAANLLYDTFELLPNISTLVHGEQNYLQAGGAVPQTDPAPLTRQIICGNGATATTEANPLQIHIAPNPTPGILLLDGEGLDRARFVWYDQTGNIIKTGQLAGDANILSLEDWPAGNYYLSLTTVSGQHIARSVVKN